MQRTNSSVTNAAGKYNIFPLGCIYLSSSLFFALESISFTGSHPTWWELCFGIPPQQHKALTPEYPWFPRTFVEPNLCCRFWKISSCSYLMEGTIILTKFFVTAELQYLVTFQFARSTEENEDQEGSPHIGDPPKALQIH